MLQSADDQLDLSAIVAALKGVTPGMAPDMAPDQRPVTNGPPAPPGMAQPATAMNPLAAALSGLMPDSSSLVPDNAGGMVPSTNSHVAPDGSFLPSGQATLTPSRRMQLASALDPSLQAQSAAPAPQAAASAPGAPSAVGLNAAGGAIPVPGYDGTFTRAQANDADGVPSKAEWDAAASGAPQPASSAEDPTLAAYRQAHDNAVQLYNQSVAQAKAFAAAGNTAGAEASWKVAEQASKHADDLNDKAIEYAKPDKDATQIVQLANGTFQTVNKATGALIGTPIGTPTPAPVAPRLVTMDERKTWDLPETGAFTIVPGESPKAITGAGVTTEASLPKEAVDDLAARYNVGDNTAVQILGYGSAANRAAVLTRAAELRREQGMSATDQTGNQISLGGQKQAARTSGGLSARINTFAEEAKQTVPMALQASEAVPRGQWVPITAIEQMGEAAASNPALSTFQAANNELANTYSKAINPSGVLTDEGRRAAFAILNIQKSPEAYRAAVMQLYRGMGAAQSGVNIIRQQSGGAAAVPPSSAPVMIQGDEDFDKLPSGARFYGPDGRARIKP